MPVLFLLFMLLPLSSLASEDVVTKIHNIDFGQPQQDILVFLENGFVAKLPAANVSIVDELVKFKHRMLRIKMDSNRFITQIKHAKDVLPETDDRSTTYHSEEFEATPIKLYSLATRYFKEARIHKKKSECFNRSMVWSYEWWVKYKIKSHKLFLFFTSAYIRKYNGKWWFHVAPMVQVKVNGKYTERMMDKRFSKAPRSIRTWTNTFMKNNAECKPITRYSDYADFPYTGSCYIQKTHMYTYQPADLQMYEAWGYSKNDFNMQEVADAYLEALNLRIGGN